MKKIVILNFSWGSVHVADFPETLNDASEWFELDVNTNEYYGLKIRESDCQYMVVDADFEIEYILNDSYISKMN